MSDGVLVRRPWVPAAFGFTFGILFAPSSAPLADVLVGVVLLVLAVRIARARRPLAHVVLVGPFFFAGLIAGTLGLPPPGTAGVGPDLLDARDVVVEGVVADAARRAPYADRLLVDLTGIGRLPPEALAPAAGRVELWIPTSTAGPAGPPCGEAGDVVRAWARLARPTAGAWPGGGDPRAAAARRGVALHGAVAGPERCVRLRPARGLSGGVERLRAALHAAVDLRLAPTGAGPEARARAAVVKAFVTGDRSAIERDLDRAFQASGLSHLLAVSGLNLAIVAGLFVLGLERLLRRSTRVATGWGARPLAALVAIPFVLLYTGIVGASPSALRAALMVLLLLLGRILRRPVDPWTSLALALVLMLAWDPSGLGDVSLQLSFAAVAALFRLYPALVEVCAPRLATRPWWWRAPLEVALASAAATLGTAPLVGRHFHRLSLIGLVANVPAAPLGSLVLVPLSLLGALVSLVSPAIGGPILDLAGLAADALVGLAEGAAAVPLASLSFPRPTILECVLFYGATIGLSVRPARPATRRLGWGSLLALVLVAGGSVAARRFGDELRVAFLPVGQGDAAVVELPGGRVIVVDTGPGQRGSSAAARVLAPYLRIRRVTEIDLLVLTHPHADHVAGLADLASELPIREVWWTGDTREVPPELLQPLTWLPTTTVGVGTPPRRYGDAVVEVLAPVGSATTAPIVNDGSLALRVRLGRRAILLTGDAEAGSEAAMIERWGEAGLRADVLKAGHHGSRTSSTEAFLRAVGARELVLSLGLRNGFGFPHPDVVRRADALGLRVWRTDLDGLVWVETDGEDLELRSFRGRSSGPPAEAGEDAAPGDD